MPLANRSPYIAFALALACLFTLMGCRHESSAAKAETKKIVQQPEGDPEPGQMLFSSPEQAAAILKDAVLMKDRDQLITIFGPDGKQLVLTGDRIEENRDMDAFSQHLTEYLRVDRRSPTKAILRVGRENWPFPIPVVKHGGQWFYDTVAGKDELLNRRIGENELGAIAVCRAYVAAQREYARRDRTGENITQYAQKFRSTGGKKDGLYWPVVEGDELSPMGPLVAEAHAEGYGQHPPDNKPHPYHGYYFHILTAQGDAAPGGKMSYLVDGHLTKGFALIASPSAWGASGIMSFQVNQDGKVYEKNLGPETREIVKGITEFNPDKGWEEVKD